MGVPLVPAEWLLTGPGASSAGSSGLRSFLRCNKKHLPLPDIDLATATARQPVRRLNDDPRPPGSVPTSSAGTAPRRNLGCEPPLPAVRLGAGRGSRTLPPSAGRHLPARAFPGVPALGPRLAWEPPFSPRSPGRCGSLSAGADAVPTGGAGGGARATAAVRRRGAPAAPERAPPPAPPARELGRGGRGQEAASAPGSAAAGVGATGAAEPAPRAAAAGVSGRDKGDGPHLWRMEVTRPVANQNYSLWATPQPQQHRI
ncbi:translation initiation factor IF-2 [Phacochoerus africanus]|uniref:translation initiation factor IF-2 n=1 Tax=Phacochoerus africanus TaxID=41426 RepID=UPI001FDAC399|nr:translation initiation factor IF-2 [Phacochoerus africanus]